MLAPVQLGDLKRVHRDNYAKALAMLVELEDLLVELPEVDGSNEVYEGVLQALEAMRAL